VIGAPHPDAVTVEEQFKELASLLGQQDATRITVDYSASRPMLFGEFHLGSIPRVMALPAFNLHAVVRSMAVLKQRPRWNVGRVRVGRTLGSNGRPVVVGVKPNGRYTIGSYCPLTWTPGLQQIAEARAEYLLWHQALTVLADALADSLVAHAPTRPDAPQTPWIAGSSTEIRQKGNLLITPQVIAAIHDARRRGRGRRV
jgi:hypothetical protein